MSAEEQAWGFIVLGLGFIAVIIAIHAIQVGRKRKPFDPTRGPYP
jgi:hypothetical protein